MAYDFFDLASSLPPCREKFKLHVFRDIGWWNDQCTAIVIPEKMTFPAGGPMQELPVEIQILVLPVPDLE